MKKRILLIVLLAALLFGLGRITAPSVNAATVPMMFTGGIETSGVVKKISLHIVFCDYVGGEQLCAWHYFGTDPLVKPPPSGWDQWPITEHAEIQFPSDLDELEGEEVDDLLYQMARIVAGRLSGYELPLP